MDIGKEEEVVIVEPLEESGEREEQPAPKDAPEEPEPLSRPEPEKVPA